MLVLLLASLLLFLTFLLLRAPFCCWRCHVPKVSAAVGHPPCCFQHHCFCLHSCLWWRPYCAGVPAVAFFPAVVSCHDIAVILNVACCWRYCCCLCHSCCLHPDCGRHSCCCWCPLSSCWFPVCLSLCYCWRSWCNQWCCLHFCCSFRTCCCLRSCCYWLYAVDGVLDVASVPADHGVPIVGCGL